MVEGQGDADHVLIVSGFDLRVPQRHPISTPTLYPLLRLRVAPLLKMPFAGAPEGRTFEHSTFMLYARDAKSTLQPNETQRNTLIIAAVYILVIGILWYAMSIVFLRRYSCDTQACTLSGQNQ